MRPPGMACCPCTQSRRVSPRDPRPPRQHLLFLEFPLPPRPRSCPLEMAERKLRQTQVSQRCPPTDEEEGSYGRLVQSPPTSKGRKRKKDPQDARSEPGKPRRKFGPMWKRRGEGLPRNRERARYFCSDPSRNHGHVVFGPVVPGANLFTLEALLSICRTDLDVLRHPASLRPICERISPHRCCTPWSIPHFVALLHNRSSCMDITATDVQK
ncbi:hypothetical protein MTO96_034127, partial [Rhipicephalus appendiculatus]